MPFLANEIFNCEINALLDKFFDAPDKVPSSKIVIAKKDQEETDEEQEEEDKHADSHNNEGDKDSSKEDFPTV